MGSTFHSCLKEKYKHLKENRCYFCSSPSLLAVESNFPPAAKAVILHRHQNVNLPTLNKNRKFLGVLQIGSVPAWHCWVISICGLSYYKVLSFFSKHKAIVGPLSLQCASQPKHSQCRLVIFLWVLFSTELWLIQWSETLSLHPIRSTGVFHSTSTF